MRKWMAAFFCAAMLTAALPSFVSAEPEITTTKPGQTSTTTKSESLDFNFHYTSSHDGIVVNWTPSANSSNKVETVVLFTDDSGVPKNDSNFKEFTINDSTGSFTVSFKDKFSRALVYPGVYSIRLNMSSGEAIVSSESVLVPGSLQVNLSLSQNSNGLPEVKASDVYNRPVSDYKVTMTIGNVPPVTIATNSSGIAVFNFSFGVSSEFTYEMKGEKKVISSGGATLVYEASEATYQPQPSGTEPTTTTKPKTTTSTGDRTTKSSTRAKTEDTTRAASTTAEPTYPIIAGAGTTAVSGDDIAVNVSFDTQVPKSFRYANADFSDYSRLLMSREMYASLAKSASSTLMLLIKTSSQEITDDQLSSSISNIPEYKGLKAGSAEIIPLHLSLLYVNTSSQTSENVDKPDGEVKIELPVPLSIKDPREYTVAVALLDENGIQRILDTEIKDGVLRFSTDTLSSIAIIGFKGTASGGSGFPYRIVILVIFGLIALTGAFLLIYFFFLRKPSPPDGPDDGNGGNGDDGYGGGPSPDAPYNNDPPGGVFLGSFTQDAAPPVSSPHKHDGFEDIHS